MKMNYKQTLDYLFTKLPMFSRIGAAAYKKDLTNTLALVAVLGNPHQRVKTIHIAGTNGKGSTSHMLAAILQQAGYKTGLYTSPHLKDFRERIKINGEMISEQNVIDFTRTIQPLITEIEPSFFEITVAMAFDYFAKEQVDIAVIETGLGGRLDSTNIITPLLSIITNIGMDHMNMLGDTLELIAAEKAGIIKENIPVVIGEYLPETKNIFIKRAAACNAPIHFAQEEYVVSNIQSTMQWLQCEVTNMVHNITEKFRLDLNGIYQTKNLCTVLCAEGILVNQGFTIKNADEKYALAHTKKINGLLGRWQVIQENPFVVLDVGHNEDGMKQINIQITNHIAQFSNTSAQIHIIIGMVKDKDINTVLNLLPKNANYYFTQAHIPRALDKKELQQKAATHRLMGNIYDDVNIALKTAKEKATNKDLILVCGSVFLVGELVY
jgi:dihydrofolate synthase / folylpolyglutamate synthase